MNSTAYIAETQPLLPAKQDAKLELPLYAQNPEQATPPPARRFHLTAKQWKPVLLALATVAGCLGYVGLQLSRPVPVGDYFTPNPSYLITATDGAVATENVRCSNAGVEMLKQGGNAVDAAIAATFCVGVVNMFSSGIGGGGFMTVRIPPSSSGGQSQVLTLDFREKAPAASTPNMFNNNATLSQIGGLSVGIPGEPLGLKKASELWGKLSWDKLLAPSIQLAKGWTVDPTLANRMALPQYAQFMLNDPDWKAIFAPNGVLLGEGDPIKRTNYANTLQALADNGPSVFYNGSIADAIVNKTQATGGILTKADLQGYTVSVNPPIQGTYRGKKVYTFPAPSSGPAFMYMLNLLGKYPVLPYNTTVSHRMIEIQKLGFGARTRLSDPKFVNATQKALIDEVPTQAFADKTFSKITDDKTHPPEYYDLSGPVTTDHGTSHVATMDKNGYAVSVTSTVNYIFGSQVLDPVTGIILNDQMADFSFPVTDPTWYPSANNYPQPGKTPLSSMVPTIFENADGSLYTAIGASGGSRIFGAVFQTLYNLDIGQNIADAIGHGRFHDQLFPMITEIDDTYPLDIGAGLKQIGHNVTYYPRDRLATASVQGVVKGPQYIYAASDPRKLGQAAGYNATTTTA